MKSYYKVKFRRLSGSIIFKNKRDAIDFCVYQNKECYIDKYKENDHGGFPERLYSYNVGK